MGIEIGVERVGVCTRLLDFSFVVLKIRTSHDAVSSWRNISDFE